MKRNHVFILESKAYRGRWKPEALVTRRHIGVKKLGVPYQMFGETWRVRRYTPEQSGGGG